MKRSHITICRILYAGALLAAAATWHRLSQADDEVISGVNTEKSPEAKGEGEPGMWGGPRGRGRGGGLDPGFDPGFGERGVGGGQIPPVDLGRIFDTNLLDHNGDIWTSIEVNGSVHVETMESQQPESPVRAWARASGMKRLERFESAFDVSPAQRRRLELAIESDAHRFATEIDAVRRQYLGITIIKMPHDEPATGLDQKKWHAFKEDVTRCRERLRRLYDEGSLFRSVLQTTLDERQLAGFLEEQASRPARHWRALVAESLARLDDTLALTEPQHQAIEKLLLDRAPALRIEGKSPSFNDPNLRRQLVFMVLAEVDTKELEAVLNERQWKTLENLIAQGPAMRARIEAMGVLEPSGK